MAHLIRNAQIEADNWQLLDTPAAIAQALAESPPRAPGTIAPLPLWLQHRPTGLGVLLQGSDDPACLAEDLPRIELVAVNIPRFTDGRAYSIARLLRGRYGYRGELRAVGEVLQDQLYYLMRVGFDSFALRDDQDPQAAAQVLKTFSVAYQGSSDEPSPLFRRRQAFA